MPRGVRREKSVAMAEKLELLESRIEKLSRELKEAKAERAKLLKEKEQYDQAELLQALRDSGKSKEEILKAIRN